MGYREDGFFNISWSQDARDAKPSGGGKQNPPFVFPDKNIRFLDAQSELQRKFNTLSDTLKKGNYKIHRGYIRNLEQPQFGSVPISRCNFQFNPQEIRQSVAMREDMYLPLLQDVNQLSQPVGAVVNFTFDLLFDRSHELSAGSSRRDLTADQLERGQTDVFSVDPLNPNPDVDPFDIGVLADLRILYSVIGQGFSREMLEFQKKSLISNAESVLSNQANDEEANNNAGSTEGTDTGTATNSSTVGEIDDAALTAILEANYGNWGLLMPNPVRIMFSSLFMLDGFITGTNVDFLKFNTKMVPLMCRVTMNMSAMYIGFARQDTFLTKTFKDASIAIQQEKAEKEAQKSEILKALKTSAGRFGLSTSWENISSDSGWDKSIRNGERPLPVWSLVVNDFAAKNPINGTEGRAIFLGFPNIEPKTGGYDETLADGTSIRRGNDIDSILKLYEEGLNPSISYTWEINVYGAITQGTALSEQVAKNLINNNSYESNQSIKLIGKYSGTETSSSKDQWGSGTSGDGAKATRVRRRSIRGNSEVNNEALGSYAIHGVGSGGTVINTYSDVPSWLKNAFYIVEVNITVSASYASGSEQLSVSRNYVDAMSGNGNVRKPTVYLNWDGESSDSPTTSSSSSLFGGPNF